jgi:ABC-type glycerol-3-phosphate transport system substrate-binding protein
MKLVRSFKPLLLAAVVILAGCSSIPKPTPKPATPPAKAPVALTINDGCPKPPVFADNKVEAFTKAEIEELIITLYMNNVQCYQTIQNWKSYQARVLGIK